jgi:hypothetical protein
MRRAFEALFKPHFRHPPPLFLTAPKDGETISPHRKHLHRHLALLPGYSSNGSSSAALIILAASSKLSFFVTVLFCYFLKEIHLKRIMGKAA